MNVEMMPGRVLIRRDKQAQVIISPRTQLAVTGTVMLHTPGGYWYYIQEPPLAAGTHIAFTKWAGRPWRLSPDLTLWILPETDVLGILEDNPVLDPRKEQTHAS